MFDLKNQLDFFKSEADAQRYLLEVNVLKYIEELESRSSANIPPCYTDLARLHRLITSSMSSITWEFGIGYSTIVFAHALSLNQKVMEVDKLKAKEPLVVIHYAIEAEKFWMSHTEKNFPVQLKKFVTFFQSSVSSTTFNDRISHRYERLPGQCPHLIYVDGPDTRSIKLDKGCPIDWSDSDFVVNSSDLLLIEPILLPGTLVLFDGRTSNYRFIRNNVQRSWEWEVSSNSDVSAGLLSERPLGERNEINLKKRFLT